LVLAHRAADHFQTATGLTPFGARLTTSDPFRPITIRSVHADADMVIVLWDGRGIAKNAQT
jgi:hypothetical protein